jgi:hypothetical protein
MLIHTLCSLQQHVWSFFSLLYRHWLSPGNGFQCHSFLSFCVHVLSGQWLSHNLLPCWQPSHTNLLLFSVPSQDSLLITAASCYIVSAWTTQKTYLPTVLLLYDLRRECCFLVTSLLHVMNLLRLLYSCLFRDRCLVISLHAIIL